MAKAFLKSLLNSYTTTISRDIFFDFSPFAISLMFVSENITRKFYRQIAAKILGSICNHFQQIAAKYNCHQALWLFGPDQEITEVGSMNIFALFKKENGKLELVTPPLDSGLILPGITRRSVLELAREFDEFEVNERKLTIKDILNGAKDGTLLEMFGTGTAAIVTPVGNIYYDGIMNSIPTPKADKSFAQRYNHAFAIISLQFFYWIGR